MRTIAPTAAVPCREEPAVSSASADDAVLEVDGLKVSFDTVEGAVRAVDGVSYRVRRGSVLALVGESGCGKSVTAFSILRLVRKPGRIEGGRIVLFPRGGAPIDMTALRDNDELLYRVRGGLASMIFQEPMTALSPVHTVGDQIAEVVRLHQHVTPAEARQCALEALTRVGIPGPDKRLDQFPFEMSGGMRQRAVIAMALACRPELLIADEPTTALDVTVQGQIMMLMRRLKDELGSAILLITHNMGVVAQMADEVAVMYLGRIVEQGSVRAVLKQPRHPYTRGLLASLPGLSRVRRLPSIRGSVPSMLEKPPGCPFHPRCDMYVAGLCDQGGPPPLVETATGARAACLRMDEFGSDTRDEGRAP